MGGLWDWRTMRLIALSLCLALLSCSWLTAFAVSNRSDSPIEVSYGLWDLNPASQGKGACLLPKEDPPAVASTDEIHWWSARPTWRDLPPEAYSFSEERCEYRVRLEPKMALRVGRAGTYTGHDDYNRWRFPVVCLYLKTANGELFYNGEELRQRFKKHNDSLYELVYP